MRKRMLINIECELEGEKSASTLKKISSNRLSAAEIKYSLHI